MPVHPSARALPPIFAKPLRVVGLALIAGAAAGFAAAGDIAASSRDGRIGSARAFAAPAAPTPAAPLPEASADDPALADAHGFALAAQMNAAAPADCSAVRTEFRRGCEDYVAR